MSTVNSRLTHCKVYSVNLTNETNPFTSTSKFTRPIETNATSAQVGFTKQVAFVDVVAVNGSFAVWTLTEEAVFIISQARIC